jgi:hypothetical protein
MPCARSRFGWVQAVWPNPWEKLSVSVRLKPKILSGDCVVGETLPRPPSSCRGELACHNLNSGGTFISQDCCARRLRALGSYLTRRAKDARERELERRPRKKKKKNSTSTFWLLGRWYVSRCSRRPSLRTMIATHFFVSLNFFFILFYSHTLCS